MRISLNEAAFLYCILGSPGICGFAYPTVEEAVDYFFAKKQKHRKKEAAAAEKEWIEQEYIQLSLFG